MPELRHVCTLFGYLKRCSAGRLGTRVVLMEAL